MSQPEYVEPPAVRGARSHRRALAGTLAALLVLAAAIGGYLWTQKQYFVGKDGGEVAVFRGVNAHFGPFSLYSIIENSEIQVGDLTQSAAGQVTNGITASSREDAEAILARLSDELKPPCPTAASPAPTVTPTKTTAETTASRTSTKTTAPKTTAPKTTAPKTAAKATAKPTARTVSKPAASKPAVSKPAVSQTPRSTAATATPSPSTALSASDSPVPGVDCR